MQSYYFMWSETYCFCLYIKWLQTACIDSDFFSTGILYFNCQLSEIHFPPCFAGFNLAVYLFSKYLKDT